MLATGQPKSAPWVKSASAPTGGAIGCVVIAVEGRVRGLDRQRQRRDEEEDRRNKTEDTPDKVGHGRPPIAALQAECRSGRQFVSVAFRHGSPAAARCLSREKRGADGSPRGEMLARLVLARLVAAPP